MKYTGELVHSDEAITIINICRYPDNRCGIYKPELVINIAISALNSLSIECSNRALMHNMCRIYGSKRLPLAFVQLDQLNNDEADKRYLNKKAIIIQRTYRKAVANPYTPICKARLLHEFENMTIE